MTNLMRQDTAKHYRYIHNLMIARNESKPSLLSKILFALMITGICFFGSCKVCHAYTDEQAIRTIVGEAANQGYVGMVCVGEVLRTKSSLRGFYGYQAMRTRREPAWVWTLARKAWLASKTTSLTHGANHFENIHAFGEPVWVKNCVKTFEYKDHVFYKEV